jgi:signal transduction histidine kinase
LAESAEQAGAYVEILQESILVTFVFLLIFGAATGYLIARRLLRPMVAIQAAIGEIDLRKLNRRIERVSDDPEVTSLVDTLNGLFERLEGAYGEIANFSANVAHELHTPLTILRGNIEVTLSREREPDDYVRSLSEILEETLHAIHIVDSLLMLARSESTAQQLAGAPIPLQAFIEQQLDDWEVLCSLKAQQLSVAVPAGLSVLGDPALLTQLLLNLVSNASKYSSENQAMEVRAEGPDPAGLLHLIVRDSGVGIPAGDHEKVFERFYRPQSSVRKTEGAGLGLSICKVIAQAHGGTIGLTSSPGDGTTVIVALPSS